MIDVIVMTDVVYIRYPSLIPFDAQGCDAQGCDSQGCDTQGCDAQGCDAQDCDAQAAMRRL